MINCLKWKLFNIINKLLNKKFKNDLIAVGITEQTGEPVIVTSGGCKEFSSCWSLVTMTGKIFLKS